MPAQYCRGFLDLTNQIERMSTTDESVLVTEPLGEPAVIQGSSGILLPNEQILCRWYHSRHSNLVRCEAITAHSYATCLCPQFHYSLMIPQNEKEGRMPLTVRVLLYKIR